MFCHKYNKIQEEKNIINFFDSSLFYSINPGKFFKNRLWTLLFNPSSFHSYFINGLNYYPQKYFQVKPYNRVFIWPQDATEAVGMMNLKTP